MATLRDALEKTLASDPKLKRDEHAALVSLCRSLADRADDQGENLTTHLSAAYLSALKDLRRAMTESGGKEAGGGKLAQLRSVQQGKQQPKSTRRRAS